jgi:hypothetical protein
LSVEKACSHRGVGVVTPDQRNRTSTGRLPKVSVPSKGCSSWFARVLACHGHART